MYYLIISITNKRLLRQRTGGACLYVPQDRYWLGSFDAIPPTPKDDFSAAKKKKSAGELFFPSGFCWNNSGQNGFFQTFFSKILSNRSRLSQTTSDPAKTNEKNHAKIAGEGFGENFVTPISTLANNKQSYPTYSTTPAIGYPNSRWRFSRFLSIYFVRASPKKVFLSDTRSSHELTIYTPKEALNRIFVTREIICRETKGPRWQKKQAFLDKASL